MPSTSQVFCRRYVMPFKPRALISYNLLCIVTPFTVRIMFTYICTTSPQEDSWETIYISNFFSLSCLSFFTWFIELLLSLSPSLKLIFFFRFVIKTQGTFCITLKYISKCVPLWSVQIDIFLYLN